MFPEVFYSLGSLWFKGFILHVDKWKDKQNTQYSCLKTPILVEKRKTGKKLQKDFEKWHVLMQHLLFLLGFVLSCFVVIFQDNVLL